AAPWLHDAIDLEDGQGSSIAESAITAGGDAQSAVIADGGHVTISHSRLTGSGDYAVTTNFPPTQLSMSCDVIEGNHGGVAATTDATITASDIDHNAVPIAQPPPPSQYDLAVSAGGGAQSASALGNWWGQPAGPEQDQVNGPADTSASLPAASPCSADAPLPSRTAVTDLTATPGDEDVHLAWSIPTGLNIDHVVVKYAPGPEAPTTANAGTTIYTGSGNATIADQLIPGQTYSFAVFTINDDGELSGISEVSATAGTPSPPPNFTAQSGFTSAAMTWDLPEDAATTIVVRIAQGDNAPPSPTAGTAVPNHGATSATASGLAPGTDYAVSGFGTDDQGYSSDPVSIQLYGTTLTADPPSPLVLTVGERTTLAASLTESTSGDAVGDVPIEIVEHTSKGTDVAVDTANLADGSMSLPLYPSVNTKYYVYFVGQAMDLGSISHAVTVLVHPRVTIVPLKKKVRSGHRVTLAGLLAPNQTHRKLRLQKQTSTGWTTIDHHRTLAHGKFDFTPKLTGRGGVRLRVVAPATADYLRGHSAPVEVHVRSA
ncbi:MAG: hypothetical protein JO214_04250, partial [Frankiaceae bacterium]|nr:hypothetical protein [Frankiaceae bacterium]